jgi:hypothetical protein
VGTARLLLEAWFGERDIRVAPTALLSGDDVMRLRAIGPGPEVGRILEALREAQAAGEVNSRDEAERYVLSGEWPAIGNQ